MKAAHQKGWLPAFELEWERIREQRRYEIARDVMAGFAADSVSRVVYEPAENAERAVKWADALLAALGEK